MTQRTALLRLTVLQQSLHGVYVALAATAFAASLAGTAQANPMGGTVTAGQATIATPTAGQMQIRQTSDRAVIDWRSFSIGAGEAVRFQQPSASSSMLNRVTGNDPSTILGSLSANGRIYLVNQNGVFIGRGAQIDTAGLVLSTANVSNVNFMAGRLNFDQPGKPGAKIVNEGSITVAQGGLVAMVAPGVENRGVISARLGQVMLAGASTFSLDLYGDGLVNLAIKPADLAGVSDANGTPLTNYVDHTGKITAEGGRVWISAATARGLVDSSVNIAGNITATQLAGQGGSVTLLGGDKLTVSGKVDATGSAQGGSIAASAVNVALASGAVLDASGVTGGGSVLVGGTYQGAAPVTGAAQTARTLDVAAGARVSADSTGSQGGGGNIVLWSEETTRFAGHASARAGALGGDGGAIEVSGRKSLSFEGTANASAPMGKTGTLLLDPGSLTVASAGLGFPSFSATGFNSVLPAAVINNVLRTGTSVTLTADDNIAIYSQIDGRPLGIGLPGATGGGLNLVAGGIIAVNAPVVLNDGAFSSNSAVFSQANGNAIYTLGSKPITINTTNDLSAQFLVTQGNLTLASSSGSIVAGQTLGGVLNGTSQSLSALSITANAGTVTARNGITAKGNAEIRAQQVNLGQADVDGTFSVFGTNVNITGNARAGGFVAGTTAAPIGSFAMSGAESQLDAGAGGISIAAMSVRDLGAMRSAADIKVTSTGSDVTLRRMETSGAGQINVSSAGSIDVVGTDGILSRGGNVSLIAGGGHIAANAVIGANSVEGLATESAGTIGLSAKSDINVRQLVAAGRATITSAAGSITLSDSIGGADADRPTVGSLFLTAGKNVTTNGLNLTGTNGTALRVEAGTTGQGGQIVVNDRVGVTQGNLQFGGDVATHDSAYVATLKQGVYARNGNQDILFNVPVLIDGSKVVSTWKSIIGDRQSIDNPVGIVDMLLLPVSDGNVAAQALVSAGAGYRVAFSPQVGTTAGVITKMCAGTAQCDPASSAPEYWMVPKIVISNQETARSKDPGTISLLGGTGATKIHASDADYSSAALKIIVPASSVESAPVQAGQQAGNIRRFQENVSVKSAATNDPDPVEQATKTSFHVDRLQLDKDLRIFLIADDPLLPRFGVYRDVLPTVIEYDGNFKINMKTDDPLSISLVLFEGRLGRTGEAKTDQTRIPGGEFGFSSNSRPVGFLPSITSGGRAVDLSAQILSQLPAGGAIGTVPVGGEQLAAKNNVASQAAERPETVCAARDREVVGRARGDEADTGAVSPLRGAPQSIFRTSYSLGRVSESLTTTDALSIGGEAGRSKCF